jgi:hypothetical protein
VRGSVLRSSERGAEVAAGVGAACRVWFLYRTPAGQLCAWPNGATPAILAAYDAVASSPAVTARPGGLLSCREVYHAEPDEIDDDQLTCDIAYPLGTPPAATGHDS